MTQQSKAEEKKQRLLAALDEGLTQVHLDARRPGVIVPERFKVDHHLVLNVSYRFDPPDLTVSEWGVRQTLSFGGSRFQVGLPWSAIYAVASLVSREFWMYPDDMPVEIAESATERVSEKDLQPAAAPAGTPRPRAVLREVVLEEPAASTEGAQDGVPREPTPPRRGHLRVVK